MAAGGALLDPPMTAPGVLLPDLGLALREDLAPPQLPGGGSGASLWRHLHRAGGQPRL